VSAIKSFLLVFQSPTRIIFKDSNNIEEAHVLSNKENNLLDFDTTIFFFPYDVILVPTSDHLPKTTHVAHVRVTTNVDKSLTILNVTPMVVAPTNLE